MIKHGIIHTSDKYYDSQVIATTREIEKQQFTDKNLLLKDIIEGLSVITTGETSKLTIEICLDSKQRYKLTQRWRVQ